jgi:hypothetical protein
MMLSLMARRPGNPRWSSGNLPAPPPKVPGEFETFAKQLGLKEQNYADSPELQAWCRENRNRCYIPEWLLKQWGILVSDNDL